MSSQAENNIQVPLVVMNQLLTELKNANEKFERVVELGSSVAGIESAVKGLTDKLDQVIHTLHGDEKSHSTRIALLEEKLRHHETGWQRWLQLAGSMCGALALIAAAFIQYGIK
jgi:hypothetical protein